VVFMVCSVGDIGLWAVMLMVCSFSDKDYICDLSVYISGL